MADPGSTLEIRCQPPNCPDNLSKPVIHSAPLPSSATIIINVLRTYSPTPPTLRLMDGAETRLFSSCQRTPMNLMCSWQTRWPFRAGQDGAQKEEERVEQSLIKPIPLDHPCRGAPIDRIVTWICSADCLHLRTAVAVQNFVGSQDSKADCRDDGRFIDAVPQLIRSTLGLSPRFPLMRSTRCRAWYRQRG